MSTTETEIVICGSCQTPNRLQSGKSGATCGRCHEPLAAARAPGVFQGAASRPVPITGANFKAEVLEAALPVLVDCWAAWCGPCRMLAPIIDELAVKLHGRVKVGKLDADHEQATASQLGIRGLPTLLLFRNGQVVDRLVGLQSAEQIQAWLRQKGAL